MCHMVIVESIIKSEHFNAVLLTLKTGYGVVVWGGGDVHFKIIVGRTVRVRAIIVLAICICIIVLAHSCAKELEMVPKTLAINIVPLNMPLT